MIRAEYNRHDEKRLTTWLLKKQIGSLADCGFSIEPIDCNRIVTVATLRSAVGCSARGGER